jgi:RNA-directed DNA polymerase
VKRKVKDLTSLHRARLRLAEILVPVNAAVRGWAYYFRFAHSKSALSYLGHFTWKRVRKWMKKKHPKLRYKTLKRKFYPDGIFRAGNLTLFDPRWVKVERYGYRGVRIPSPWDPATQRRWKRRGDRLPDEPEYLENLETVCHT